MQRTNNTYTTVEGMKTEVPSIFPSRQTNAARHLIPLDLVNVSLTHPFFHPPASNKRMLYGEPQNNAFHNFHARCFMLHTNELKSRAKVARRFVTPYIITCNRQMRFYPNNAQYNTNPRGRMNTHKPQVHERNCRCSREFPCLAKQK